MVQLPEAVKLTGRLDDDVALTHVVLVHYRSAAGRRVLGAFLCAEDGREPASDDALDHVGITAEGRWALARVEDPEATGRPRANVEETPVSSERVFGERDEPRDLDTLARDGVSDCPVFRVHQIDDLERGGEIDVRGARVAAFGDARVGRRLTSHGLNLSGTSDWGQPIAVSP